MPCYHPVKAWRSKSGRLPNGKWPLVFIPENGMLEEEVVIPCGKCVGCLSDRSKAWAVRCIHEASLYEKNCFITLTYDNDKIIEQCAIKDKNGLIKFPVMLTLNKQDYVLFMKKLRSFNERNAYGFVNGIGHYIKRNKGSIYDKSRDGIRFFHCGEYGEMYGRPHHHACLFNFDFQDKEIRTIKNGVGIYTSKKLEELWPYGYSTIGEVNYETAAYVAKYVLKKVQGKAQKQIEYCGREQEYITMSRKPGLAREWLEKFSSDVYNQDVIILKNSLKSRPPRYYDNIYETYNPTEMENIKCKRKEKVNEKKSDPVELLRREEFKKQMIKQSKRSYEKGV